ncbi:histone-lysine N-methyltransferase 2C-like [Anneissia japonica]|uniref:histone-lysine N-methyltransferase 2C-like n=1 Tax=Anneissia japonica TaxID=1529436 RepID=UPI0014256955|nr:histone-lysine N-methyltransferase 2C-like [Anneissia japonica]
MSGRKKKPIIKPKPEVDQVPSDEEKMSTRRRGRPRKKVDSYSCRLITSGEDDIGEALTPASSTGSISTDLPASAPSSHDGTLQEEGMLLDPMDIKIEDEGLLDNSVVPKINPGFERSLTDETAPAISLPSEELESSEPVCSLCCCGEKSLLGQGDLLRFDPTPGFNPFKKLVPRRKTSEDDTMYTPSEKSPKNVTSRRVKGLSKTRESSRSPRGSNPAVVDRAMPGVDFDELSMVGYAEEPEVNHVFEPSGHCTAHHCCAAWSENVCQNENFQLLNVDKAVFTGLSQRCSYCRRFGATIKCRVLKCTKFYHYPCAASCGAFQDIKTMSLLCLNHLDQAEDLVDEEELTCVFCRAAGNIIEMLFCTSCGQHYHGNCLDPPVPINAVVRAGWQCPDCKICQTCRQPGDDNKILLCDSCDKGYHTFCLKPAMTTIPKHGWKCKNCRVCGDCGSRTPGSGPSSRWHRNYSVCDSCYQQRNKGLYCPICGKAYRQHATHKLMVQCDRCTRFVHAECDSNDVIAAYQKAKSSGQPGNYICPDCRSKPSPFLSSSQNSLMSEEVNSGTDTEPETYTLSTHKDKEAVPVRTSSRHICPRISIDSVQFDDNMDISQDPLLRSPTEESQTSMDLGFMPDYSCLSIQEEAFGPCSTPSLQAQHTAVLSAAHSFFPSVGKASKKKIGAGRPRGKGNLGLVGRKRSKPGATGAKRGPKPKSKLGMFPSGLPMVGASSTQEVLGRRKDEDEEDSNMHTTVVLFSSDDKFTYSQDMCVSCGSFGKGAEGRLLTCSQCGQCYHPYCVNIRITKVVLSKGWRCLDCTVCEGCGKASDESRLLLCDDCDISYHTYCLDPPLMTVPKGGWKCKWCVKCLQCGATTPGYNAEWQKNYTLCAPCGSCLNCMVCLRQYAEGELIIQCIQCERWSHALCDGLHTEEELERVADKGYHCTWCRPMKPLSPPPPQEVKSPPPLPKVIIKIPKEDIKPKQYSVEGVYLTELGFQQITSMSHHRKKSRKKRKSSHGFSLLKKLADPNSEPTKDLTKHYSSDGSEKYHKERSCDDEEEHKVIESSQLDFSHKKKRQKRKPYRPGIGGFIARPKRGGGVGPCLAPRKTQADLKPDIPMVEAPSGMKSPTEPMSEGQANFVEPMKEGEVQGPLAEGEKPKKKRRARKKSILEQKFPSYIQEAFFGKELLVFSKKRKGSPGISDEESNSPAVVRQKDTEIVKPPESVTSTSNVAGSAFGLGNTSDNVQTSQEQQDLGSAEDALNLFTHDDEIFGMLMEDGLGKHGGGIDLDAVAAEEPHQTTGAHPDNSEHHGHSDDFDSILNSNLGQMVPDDLSHIDSKEVIDLFGSVLSPTDPHPSTTSGQVTVAATAVSVSSSSQVVMHSHLTSLATTSQAKAHPNRPTTSLPPTATQGLVSPSFSPDFTAPPSPWPSGEGDTEGMSYTQKAVKKWEKDEHLGNLATISPVLYANMNYPDLKKDYPDWPSRAKQIQKLWRKVPPEEKQPFLQYAKDNRSTQKLKVTQKLSEGIMRKKMVVNAPGFGVGRGIPVPGSVNQPIQGVGGLGFPVPMIPQPIGSPVLKRDMGLNDKEQKEVKLQKEQEQERRWKLLQQSRIEEQQQIPSGEGKKTKITGAGKSGMMLEMPEKSEQDMSGAMMNVPLPVQSPVGVTLQQHAGGPSPQHAFQSSILSNPQPTMMSSPMHNNLPHGPFSTMDQHTPGALGHATLETDHSQGMPNEQVNLNSLPGTPIPGSHNQPGAMAAAVSNNTGAPMPQMHLALPMPGAPVTSVPPSPVHSGQMIATGSQVHSAVTPGNEASGSQFMQSNQFPFQGQGPHLAMSATDEKFQNRQHLKELLMRRKKREPQTQGVTAHWQGEDVQRGPPPPYPGGTQMHANQPGLNPNIRAPFQGGAEFSPGFAPRMGFDNPRHPQPEIQNMPNPQGVMQANAPGGLMPQWKQGGQFVSPRMPTNQPDRPQGPYIELKHGGIARARNPHMAILHERLQQRAGGVQFQQPRMPLRPVLDAHGNSLDPYDHLVRQNHANQGMPFPVKSEAQIQHQLQSRTTHVTSTSLPATPTSSAPTVPFTGIGHTQQQQFQGQPMVRVHSQPHGEQGQEDHDAHLEDLFKNGEFNILDLADPLIDTNKHSEDNLQLFRDLGIGDEKDDESKQSHQKQSLQRTSSQSVDDSSSIPQENKETTAVVTSNRTAMGNEAQTRTNEHQKDDITEKSSTSISAESPKEESDLKNISESSENSGSEKKSETDNKNNSNQANVSVAVETSIEKPSQKSPQEEKNSNVTDKTSAKLSESPQVCDGIHGCPGDKETTEKSESGKSNSETDDSNSNAGQNKEQGSQSKDANLNPDKQSEITTTDAETSDSLDKTEASEAVLKGIEVTADAASQSEELGKNSSSNESKQTTECCGDGNCSPKPDDNKSQESLPNENTDSLEGTSDKQSEDLKVDLSKTSQTSQTILKDPAETSGRDANITDKVVEPSIPPQSLGSLSAITGQETETVQQIKTETVVLSKRTPLLDEQPLLLQDLLDQEKLEQQKQQQENPGVAGPGIKTPTPDPYLNELDFEKLKAEVRQFAKEAELKAPGPHAQLLQAMNRQHQEQLQQIQQQQFSGTAQQEAAVVDQLVQPEVQPSPGLSRMPAPDPLINKQGTFSPNPQPVMAGPRFPIPVGQQSPMVPGQMPLRPPQQGMANTPGQMSPMNSGMPSPVGSQVFPGMQRPPVPGVPRMPGGMTNHCMQGPSPSPIPHMMGNMLNQNQRVPASSPTSVPRMPGGIQSPGGNMVMPMPSPNSIQHMPGPQGQPMGEIPLGMMSPGMANQQARMQMSAQKPALLEGQGFMPPFSDEPAPNPQDRVQHQQWLLRKEQHLQLQVKSLDTEISKFRKRKKVLSARQRSCKKSNRVFPENDVKELEALSQQYGGITKKLEAARKLVRQHSSLMEEYGLKPQKALSGPANMMQRPPFQGQQNIMMGNAQIPFMHPRGMMPHMIRQQMNPHLIQGNQGQMMPGKPGAMIQHFQQTLMMPQGQTPMMQLGGQPRMMVPGQQSPMMMGGQQGPVMQQGQSMMQGGQMLQPGQQMHVQSIMQPSMMQGGMLHGGQPMMQPGQQIAMNQQGMLQQPGMMEKLRMLPVRQPGHQSPMLHPGQQSPMLQPGQQSPMMPPGQQSPMMPPGQQSPMMPLGQQSPMMPPGQQTPMMPPGQQSPMILPGQQSPMIPPGQQSPMIIPGQQSPMVPPGQQSPMMQPGQQSPMIQPGQKSPMLQPGQQSPMIQPGQQSPMVPQPSPLMPSMVKLSQQICKLQINQIQANQMQAAGLTNKPASMMHEMQRQMRNAEQLSKSDQISTAPTTASILPALQSSPMVQQSHPQSPMVPVNDPASLAHTDRQSPMVSLGHQSPVVSQGQQSPMVLSNNLPGQQSPLTKSDKQSPVVTPGQQSPIVPPGQQSPMPGHQSPMIQAIQQSPQGSQPSPVISTLDTQGHSSPMVPIGLQQGAQSPMNPATPSPIVGNNPKFPTPPHPGMVQNPMSSIKPPMSPRVTPAVMQQQQHVQISVMDNNPFSEAFQARERQAKLEQQSERQRIQLVQEIEKIKMQHMKQEQGQNPIAGLQTHTKSSQGEMAFYNQDPLGFPMQDPNVIAMQSTNETLNHIQQVISQQSQSTVPMVDSLQMPPPEGFPMPPNYPVSQDKKEKPKKKRMRKKNQKKKDTDGEGSDGNVMSNVRPGRPLPLMPLDTTPAPNDLMAPEMCMQKPEELVQQASSNVISSANPNIPVNALPILAGIDEHSMQQLSNQDPSMLSGAQKTFLQNQLLKQLLQGPAIYGQHKVGALPPHLAELAQASVNQNTDQVQPALPNGNNGTGREPEEEEEEIKLTPEQLKQLEMLEKLPYVIKKKDGKPAKNDHEILMELHREEIQEKRKQFEIEENRKQKKKEGAKKSPKERAPRKRKKLSKSEAKNQDNIMNALKQLPVLDLCEPEVVINFALCQPVGSSALNGKNKLLGKYGYALIDGVRDFYGLFPNGVLESNNPPTPPSSPPIKKELNLVNGEIHTGDVSKKLLKQRTKSGGMPGLRASPLSSVVPVSDVTLTTGDELLREMQSHQRTITRAANLAYSGVNVPPSLPTPPPSNISSAEEANRLRVRMLLHTDSSVPSSSPELDDSEPVRYKGLRLITENAESLCKKERSTSPAFAIVKPTPRRGVIKNTTVGSSVTLTLNQQAGNNPHNVIVSLSEILKIPVPSNIQLNNLAFKQDLSLGTNKGDSPVKEAHNLLVSASSSRQRFCKHCDVLILGEAFYKPTDATPPGKSPDPSSVFCSTNCFMQWTLTQRTQTLLNTQELTGPVVNHPSHKSLLPPKLVSPTQISPPPVSPGPPSPPRPEVKIEEVKIADVKREYKEILKEAKEASALKEAREKEEARLAKEAKEWKVKAQIKRKLAETPKPQPMVKKWKNIRYKKWSEYCLPRKKYADPVEEDIDVLIQKLGTSLRPGSGLEDARNCILCSDVGDGDTNGSARLLNCNVNSWVHLNCALWSYEVYETLNGALMNVHTSIKRGLANKCCYCSKFGATVHCHKVRCLNIYHFGCAINDNCMFFKDKTMLCPLHAPSKITESTLGSHTVFRRVYISRDEHKQVARVMQDGENKRTLRVGSLVFKCIGQLLPHQMQSFHSSTAIYPVGFEATRLYWSMRYTNKRCSYVCTIGDSGGKPVFTIRVQEQGHEDVTVQDSTIKGVWQKILLPIEKLRREADMLKLFPRFITGEDMYGLQEPAILHVLESLPGVELIQNYNFRYGRSPYLELPLAINPSGCARTEPKMRTHVKRSHTLTSNTTSRSYHQPLVTGDSIYPYKTFVHSKTSQYRKMKSDWKSNVFLGRSQIQGLGLYAAKDIEKHTMVIEYIGTLIRNEVADRKEKHYEESNRGIYMFRLDDDQVIDATLSGNSARYINHSCNPNCVAEVVSFEKDNKIIIISNRRISKGEELTYDYKFDFEDDSNKIPCGCKAPNCRKWMN